MQFHVVAAVAAGGDAGGAGGAFPGAFAGAANTSKLKLLTRAGVGGRNKDWQLDDG